jgi:CheY-like chemotaxis protein
MHALSLTLEALAERIDDAETTALVRNAQISADGVTGVLDSLLGIAAMEAKGSKPEISQFAISDLLTHLRDQFGERAAHKNIELRILPCTLVVDSDRQMVLRILETLVSNAIHHTDCGRILIGCRRTKDVLRIGILDNQPGQSTEMANRFSPDGADQSAPDTESNWQGYALGLSIAKNICARLGQDMLVISRADKGKAIWLNIALSAVQKARQQSKNGTKPSATPAAETEGGATIAIVEDNPDILLATTQFLTGWGYHVYGGGSAGAVIQNLEVNGSGVCPNLVLSDFNLRDGMTAVDAIADLNQHYNSKIPAIIITGDPSAPGIDKARALNYEILFKPLRAAKLRALVRYTLEQNA